VEQKGTVLCSKETSASAVLTVNKMKQI